MMDDRDRGRIVHPFSFVGGFWITAPEGHWARMQRWLRFSATCSVLRRNKQAPMREPTRRPHATEE